MDQLNSGNGRRADGHERADPGLECRHDQAGHGADRRRPPRARPGARMLLQVHDELLFEAPPEEIVVLEPLVREIMEFAMPIAVPAKVDIKIGDDWSEE
jgi:hypothetical protein